MYLTLIFNKTFDNFSGVLHLESSIQGTQQTRRQEIRRKQLCVTRCTSRVNPRTLCVRQCVSVHGSRKRSRCFDDPQRSSPRSTAHSSEFFKGQFKPEYLKMV